jgi:hypothetical protein
LINSRCLRGCRTGWLHGGVWKQRETPVVVVVVVVITKVAPCKHHTPCPPIAWCHVFAESFFMAFPFCCDREVPCFPQLQVRLAYSALARLSYDDPLPPPSTPPLLSVLVSSRAMMCSVLSKQFTAKCTCELLWAWRTGGRGGGGGTFKLDKVTGQNPQH